MSITREQTQELSEILSAHGVSVKHQKGIVEAISVARSFDDGFVTRVEHEKDKEIVNKDIAHAVESMTTKLATLKAEIFKYKGFQAFAIVAAAVSLIKLL